MIEVNDDDREFLIENIPNAEAMLLSDDLGGILDELDTWIALHGYTSGGDEEYVLKPIGRKAERIFDRIYYGN